MTFGLPGSGETEASEMVAKTFRDFISRRSHWHVDELDRTMPDARVSDVGRWLHLGREGRHRRGRLAHPLGQHERVLLSVPAGHAVTRSEAWDALIAGPRNQMRTCWRGSARGVHQAYLPVVADLIQGGQRASAHELRRSWRMTPKAKAQAFWSFPFLYPPRRGSSRRWTGSPPGSTSRSCGVFTRTWCVYPQGSLARACLFASTKNTNICLHPKAVLSENEATDWRVAKFNENHALFDRFLLDSSNPIYEVFKRGSSVFPGMLAAVNALGAVRYLYAAFTSAIWMAHGELPARFGAGDLVIAPSAETTIPELDSVPDADEAENNRPTSPPMSPRLAWNCRSRSAQFC